MMRTVSKLLTLAVVATSVLIVPVAAAPAAKAASKAKNATTGAPKKAVCPVCALKTGKKELEPVKASLKYKGRTYYFCDLKDKAEFISNPSKYAAAVK